MRPGKNRSKLKPLQQSYTMKAPHFVYYVRDDVEKVLGPALLAKGGLRIYTTLDPKLQAHRRAGSGQRRSRR